MKINSNGFKAVGTVVGNFWGGGIGAYNATRLAAEDKEQLFEDIKKKLVSGSLDDGMGFESLIFATITVIEEESVTVENKEFTRENVDNYMFVRKEKVTPKVQEIIDESEDVIIYA